MFGKSEKRSLNKTTYDLRALFKGIGLVCGRITLLGCIALVGVYSLDYARHPADVAERFKLRQIRYEGLVQLDRQALDSLIDQSISENVLLIDLDRIRDLVESESWVKEATVRRKLPDQLVIHIAERQAAAVAAIDSELYVVDVEAVILDRPGPQHQLIDRPIVKGLKNVARENAREENALRMRVYLRVLEELAPYHHSISEIDVEISDSVAIIPKDDPVPIYLGDQHFLRRYETFISQKDLYDRLKEEYGAIESVDVTYDDKIIFHTPQGKGTTVTAQASNQS